MKGHLQGRKKSWRYILHSNYLEELKSSRQFPLDETPYISTSVLICQRIYRNMQYYRKAVVILTWGCVDLEGSWIWQYLWSQFPLDNVDRYKGVRGEGNPLTWFASPDYQLFSPIKAKYEKWQGNGDFYASLFV